MLLNVLEWRGSGGASRGVPFCKFYIGPSGAGCCVRLWGIGGRGWVNGRSMVSVVVNARWWVTWRVMGAVVWWWRQYCRITLTAFGRKPPFSYYISSLVLLFNCLFTITSHTIFVVHRYYVPFWVIHSFYYPVLCVSAFNAFLGSILLLLSLFISLLHFFTWFFLSL